MFWHFRPLDPLKINRYGGGGIKSVSFFRWGDWDPTLLGPLERASVTYRTFSEKGYKETQHKSEQMFAFALGEIRTKQRKVANVSCRSC